MFDLYFQDIILFYGFLKTPLEHLLSKTLILYVKPFGNWYYYIIMR